VSSALAVAAVTAVLRDLLNNGVIANDLASVAGSPVKVSARPPDLITVGAGEEPGLNLFLYHLTPNQGWRNEGLPSRDGRGDRVSNPPLALDLHYLLMAYGREEYQAEILMGYAMQLLHETPVLTRDAVRTSLSAIPSLQLTGSILPPAFQALAAADLADQIELVKICPESLGIEELSKLWSAFQANYFRLTTGYQASVVLIQNQRSTRAALPVLKPNLYVVPLKSPRIREVVSAATPPADPRIVATSTIVINGAGMRGEVTTVRIGEVTVTPADPTDTRIAVDLSGVSGLRAGVQATQVVHQLLMGDPPPGALHRGFESNVVPFVLHPSVTLPGTVSLGTGAITATFAPNVGRAQRVTLFLHERGAPNERPPRAYSLPAPRDNGLPANSPATEVSTITFTVAGVEAGDYLAYARVDGAESPLGLAAGQFDSPAVTITP
jgi:Pvc16 N-terminal domain